MLNKIMKKINLLIILLFFSTRFFIAQSEEEVMRLEQEHKTQMFFEQNLNDFNEKITLVIKSSYKRFETITEENKLTVDFESGVNEKIAKNKDQKSFSVVFEVNQDELLAIALKKELANRIMSIVPKGYVQTEEKTDQSQAFIIEYNNKNQEKGSFQPVIKVSIDYINFNVSVIVSEPIKK